MITLEVYFYRNEQDEEGTAVLHENLITGDIRLNLSKKLYLDEVIALINKAVDILKLRYKEVKTNINWDSEKQNKEREEN